MTRSFYKIYSVHPKEKYIKILTTPKQSNKLERFLFLCQIKYTSYNPNYTSNIIHKCEVTTKQTFLRLLHQIKQWDDRYDLLTDSNKKLKEYEKTIT